MDPFESKPMYEKVALLILAGDRDVRSQRRPRGLLRSKFCPGCPDGVSGVTSGIAEQERRVNRRLGVPEVTSNRDRALRSVRENELAWWRWETGDDLEI